MKLLDIRIDGFGKLNDRYISFEDGINLVTGHNEAGKSTLHACIRAMLYGMERAKGVAALTDMYSHFKPWNGRKYGGVLRIEHEGKVYSINRDFDKDPVSCTIFNETEGEAVMFADGLLRDVLCGMSAEAYDNTISIGQLKSTADEGMAAELKKYIINMDTTGNRTLSCTEAKKYLAEQKRLLAEEISPDAAKNLNANLGEIRNLEKEIGSPEYINKINDLEKEREENEKVIEENSNEIRILEEGITADREKLEKVGTNSSMQAGDEENRFDEVLRDYEDELATKAVIRNRVLYIVFFCIAVLASVAAAYLTGAGIISNYLLPCELVFAAGIIGGIVFLILCLVAKSRLNKKRKALSEMIIRHSGYEDIMPERIARVKEKLSGTWKLAADVERRESCLTELNRKGEELAEHDSKLERDLAAQKESQTELMLRLRRLNALHKENEILRAQIEKNDRIGNDLEAIDIAANTISELEIKMKDSLGVFLNGQASKYIRKITDGAYDSISIDDNMDVFMNTESKMVPIEQLSSGTSDQVYMALRLAGARLVQDGEDKLPLIFDDSFVNYDENRLSSTLKWLAGEYKEQIIIFSCHKREEKIMDEEEIRYQKVEM